MTNERLKKQIQFIIEIDKLKNIFRRSVITDKSRLENDAEHSWHVSLMALLLLEYANDKDVDVLKVIKMLVIHDIVEIDAGDIIVYDIEKRKEQEIIEQSAADRLFGLLPQDQKDEFKSLWREFEDRETSEAKYARVLDRLQPLLLNYYTQGKAWKKAGIKSSDVIKINSIIKDGSEELWDFTQQLIQKAVNNGFLTKG